MQPDCVVIGNVLICVILGIFRFTDGYRLRSFCGCGDGEAMSFSSDSALGGGTSRIFKSVSLPEISGILDRAAVH